MEKPGSAIMTAQLGIQLTIVVVAARNSCGIRVATACCPASPLSKNISTSRTYTCVEVAVPVVVIPVSDLVRGDIGETAHTVRRGRETRHQNKCHDVVQGTPHRRPGNGAHPAHDDDAIEDNDAIGADDNGSEALAAGGDDVVSDEDEPRTDSVD